MASTLTRTVIASASAGLSRCLAEAAEAGIVDQKIDAEALRRLDDLVGTAFGCEIGRQDLDAPTLASQLGRERAQRFGIAAGQQEVGLGRQGTGEGRANAAGGTSDQRRPIGPRATFSTIACVILRLAGLRGETGFRLNVEMRVVGFSRSCAR